MQGQELDPIAELRTRVAQQQVVAELGLFALASGDVQELMDLCVERAARTLGMHYCKVLELLPSGDELLLRSGVGWKAGLVGVATVKADRGSQAGYTLQSQEPVIVTDLPAETRFAGPPLLVEHGVISGMSVIIHGTDGAYGVLGVHDTKPRAFASDDVHFVQAVANIIGEAVQRRRVEEALQRARNALEQRVQERTKELESFVYSVSHDLRAPLRAISGFARALQDAYRERLDDQGRHYVDRIIGNSERMGQQIEALLDLSRLTRTELRRDEVDLSALASEVLERLRQDDRGRRVDIRIEPNIRVHADPRLMETLLTNLLGNAWKFTNREELARIEVGWSAEHGAFYVGDNGAGFDMKDAEKLFSPFRRAHSPDEFEGLGVGLATVAKVVDVHGGSIWAHAEIGSGATFFVRLPQLAPGR